MAGVRRRGSWRGLRHFSKDSLGGGRREGGCWGLLIISDFGASSESAACLAGWLAGWSMTGGVTHR